MRVIYSNIIPFPGYRAMMLFGVIFARKKAYPLSEYTINHEAIHREQARDCGGYIPYYIVYIWHWIRRGYRQNPFEREAYDNVADLDYLQNRTPKAWKKYKK